jgi:hypothetical protein
MRSSSFVLVVFVGLGLFAGEAQVRSGPVVANTGISWDTVIFRDDFGSAEVSMPNPEYWVINHPPVSWWKQARTHFPNPDPYPPTGWVGWVPTGEFPRVEKGALVIEHHLYNPYDNAPEGEKRTFLGGEVHTVQEFSPDRPYRFEARVKLDPGTPNGLVTSFFLYGYDGSNSDEIDFEFLSNQMNDNKVYPNGDPVLTNTFNESRPKPEKVIPDGLDLTDWNTFRIYWYPDKSRVDWTWVIQPDTPDEREMLLRSETNPYYIPDEPMGLYFNFWAPCYTSWRPGCDPWDGAADPKLQPVSDPSLNEISAYEIDYVEVRVPEPRTLLCLAAGAAWLFGRRRRTRLQTWCRVE